MEPQDRVRLPPHRVRRGIRSSCDAKPWECYQCNTMNLPEQRLLFDLPSFRCSGCSSLFVDDFDFCYDLVMANKRRLIGGLDRVKNQRMEPECIAYSIASCLETAERIRKVLQGKNPDSVRVINPNYIVHKFEDKCRANISDGETSIGKLVTMALTVQTDGIDSEDRSKRYTAVAVETIDRFDFERICSVVADGIPLVAAFYSGERLENLKYCQIYRAPILAQFLEKNMTPIGHAAVIIGAGVHSGKQYLYFLNSWGIGFCPRYDQDRNLVKAGVGKLRLYDLICNPILFATDVAECVGQNRLVPLGIGKLSNYNKRMMMSQCDQTDVIPEDLVITGVSSGLVGHQPKLKLKRKVSNVSCLDMKDKTEKRNKVETSGHCFVNFNEVNIKADAKGN